MLLDVGPNESLETRARPARRARWQRYLPGTALAASGGLVLLSPPPLVDRLMALGLTRLGALLVLASGLVLLAATAARLAGRHPLVTLLAGTLALSLGANLTTTAWMGLPLLVGGIGWLLFHEADRAMSGLALTDRRVLLPRTLRKPLGLSYQELRVVHTTDDEAPAGSLILETEHGTLTVKDLAGHTTLAERIGVRMDAGQVPPEAGAVAEARARIERVLKNAGGTPG